MTRNVLAAAVGAVFVIAALLSISVAPPSFPGLFETDRVPATEAKATITPPFMMFRVLTADDSHGRVAMVALGSTNAPRHIAPLSCVRVHYAGGRGVCVVDLVDGRKVTRAADIFDNDFTRGQRVALDGIVIRARVSPNGKWAAITVYAEEEAPGGEERLGTSTVLVDIAAQRTVDLRTFTIDGTDAPPVDERRDLSSVAFAHDGDRLFATLFAAGQYYVLQGSLATRTFRVLRPGFANEAVSPDDRRLVVKRRSADGTSWRLSVLELTTMAEQPLDQGHRGVDDQVEWLDESNLIYHDAAGDGTGVWSLAADGSGPPRLLIANAYSPAVAR